MKVLAIGDIHGQYRHLELMLEAAKEIEHDELVFIGDYIDRGENSREVIKILQGLSNAVFLRGNHEDMAIRGLDMEFWKQNWYVNGGNTVLKDYGGNYDNVPEELIADLRWLEENTKFFHIIDDHLFVHAGINPHTDDQTEEDMLWIRQEFLKHPHPLPYYVVHGHTPYDDDLTKLNGDIDIRTNRCNIDGGSVYGGLLIGAVFDTKSKSPNPQKILRVGEMELAIDVCSVEEVVQ